jgi:hypothetical protein
VLTASTIRFEAFLSLSDVRLPKNLEKKPITSSPISDVKEGSGRDSQRPESPLTQVQELTIAGSSLPVPFWTPFTRSCPSLFSWGTGEGVRAVVHFGCCLS